MVSESQGSDFSEGETYDFTRCMRPDGTSFGTKGKCAPPNRAAGPSQAEQEAAQDEEQARRLMSGGRRHSLAMQARAKELLQSAKKKRANADQA